MAVEYGNADGAAGNYHSSGIVDPCFLEKLIYQGQTGNPCSLSYAQTAQTQAAVPLNGEALMAPRELLRI